MLKTKEFKANIFQIKSSNKRNLLQNLPTMQDKTAHISSIQFTLLYFPVYAM